MTPVMIIEVEVPTDRFAALVGAVVREAIDAFAKERLNQSLRLSIRLGTMRTRSFAPDGQLIAGVGELSRDVAWAVVSEHAPDRNAQAGEPALGVPQKGSCRGGIVGRHHLHVGNARMI